jgi:diguanylate cyclase (GGDEF)-like protein/PAS domain S-box-containing protein
MALALRISQRIIRDIDTTEQELKVSENRFKALYDSNILGIIDWHGDGRVLDANPSFLQMLGYQQQDVSSGQLNWRDLTPEDGYTRDNEALTEIQTKGYCTPFEKEFYHKNGQRISVLLGVALLGGEQDKGICFTLDLTERKHNETQLKLAATVFDASSNGILITDAQLCILTVNQAICDMTGYDHTELQGKTPKILQSGLMPRSFYDELNNTLKKNGRWAGDLMDKRKDGSLLPVHMTINAVFDENNDITHYVTIYTDISEHKATEDKLRQLANSDCLTGLANRSLYTDRLEHALQRARRNGNKLAVLFFDLDHFKPVNDLYGHEVGDKLLQEVANRVTFCVRENDTVARIGGDEFVVLLEDLQDRFFAGRVANKIIDTIRQPIHIDNHSIEVGCSVGISVYPDDDEDVIGLTRSADIAMYAAKSSGRNCFYFFNPGFNNKESYDSNAVTSSSK